MSSIIKKHIRDNNHVNEKSYGLTLKALIDIDQFKHRFLNKNPNSAPSSEDSEKISIELTKSEIYNSNKKNSETKKEENEKSNKQDSKFFRCCSSDKTEESLDFQPEYELFLLSLISYKYSLAKHFYNLTKV